MSVQITAPTVTGCLDAALRYLALGWSPLALHPHSARVDRPGKQPIGKWEQWQDQRPAEADLRAWWATTPDANVGLCLGPVSGLVGLDVDGDAGTLLLREWEKEEEALPGTLQFLTPNGRRLLFALPDGTPLPTRRFDVGNKEALRLLSHGSQTVMPPSTLATGAYAWLPGSSPGEIAPAVCPAWLLRRLLKEGPPGGGASVPLPPAPGRPDRLERARLYLRTCEPAISGQGGHDQTIKVADKIAIGFDLDDDEAFHLLWEDYNPRCRPPWDRHDLRRKVAEARKTTTKSPGYLLSEPRRVDSRPDRGPPAGNGSTAPEGPPARQEGRGPADLLAVARRELAARPGRHHDAGPVFRLNPVNNAVFDARQFHTSFLIDDLLVAAQPMILAGPEKSLKTSIALDLAVSLATATPALNRFRVGRPCRVLFLSGESGEAKLQATQCAIHLARGLAPDASANLYWPDPGEVGPRLPRLGLAADRAALTAGLQAVAAEVVFLDPMYLCLLAGANDVRAENALEMGPLLAAAADAIRAAGCAPIFVHHTKAETSAFRGPLALHHLMYPSFALFARQWLLVSRREEFAGQPHRLFLAAGGSAGHGGRWEADIDDGLIRRDPLEQRWTVVVREAAAAPIRGPGSPARKEREQEQKFLDAMRRVAGMNKVRTEAGMNALIAEKVAARLLMRGLIEAAGYRNGTESGARKPNAFRLRGPSGPVT